MHPRLAHNNPNLDVTVWFMCQFDWAMGCPDTWSDILGVCARVFLDTVNIYIGRLSKADCPP